MITVNSCVCCGSEHLEVGPAWLTCFIVDRMLGLDEKNYRNSVRCKYLRCFKCDYAGIDLRFTKEEEARHYKNYMLDDYINSRCEYEGYESQEFFKYFASSDFINSRKTATSEFLKKFLSIKEIESIESVLDYGGNTGELIPDDLSHAKKYVFDFDSRISSKDIIFLNEFDFIEPVDLVIFSHTLEHVSYPIETLNDIKKFLKPGGKILVEVPNESIEYTDDRFFHEHINIWNKKSLRTLFEANGFHNISIINHDYMNYKIGNVIVLFGELK